LTSPSITEQTLTDVENPEYASSLAGELADMVRRRRHDLLVYLLATAHEEPRRCAARMNPLDGSSCTRNTFRRDFSKPSTATIVMERPPNQQCVDGITSSSSAKARQPEFTALGVSTEGLNDRLEPAKHGN